MPHSEASGRLAPLSAILGTKIEATDGRIGSITDVLFDDREWCVRWFVVDTGRWLPGRQVLLPPIAVDRTNPVSGVTRVVLNRDQIEKSPDFWIDEPVSRQREAGLFAYYGQLGYGPMAYPYTGALLFAPASIPLPPTEAAGFQPDRPIGDAHLRSGREITGYYVRGNDGDIGHVEDILVDVEDWSAQKLVIDTKNWWPGKKVLIPLEALRKVDWESQQAHVRLSRDQIENSPIYEGTDSRTVMNGDAA